MTTRLLYFSGVLRTRHLLLLVWDFATTGLWEHGDNGAIY
jgi:hypothetical protein